MNTTAFTTDSNHRTIEATVTSYLNSHDYYIANQTYHDNLPPEIVSKLQRTYNPTAQCIRTRSDRIAVHSHQDISFFLEFKTSGKAYDSGAAGIEAYPLAQHRSSSLLGTKTLYIYADPTGSYGFWADKIKPTSLFLPDHPKNEPIYESLLRAYNDIPKRLIKATNGSSDPFVLVPKSQMFDWQKEINLLRNMI